MAWGATQPILLLAEVPAQASQPFTPGLEGRSDRDEPRTLAISGSYRSFVNLAHDCSLRTEGCFVRRADPVASRIGVGRFLLPLLEFAAWRVGNL